jgi:hypothetical protein
MDGYSFDPASIQRVRQAWSDLRDGLEQDRKAAEEILAAVKAPGHEPASGFVAENQNSSGQALRTSILKMQAFVNSYLVNLDLAEREYEAQEAITDQRMRGNG